MNCCIDTQIFLCIQLVQDYITSSCNICCMELNAFNHVTNQICLIGSQREVFTLCIGQYIQIFFFQSNCSRFNGLNFNFCCIRNCWGSCICIFYCKYISCSRYLIQFHYRVLMKISCKACKFSKFCICILSRNPAPFCFNICQL